MNKSRREFLKITSLGFIGAGVYSSLPGYLLADNSKKFKNGIEVMRGIKLMGEIPQKNIESLAHSILPGTKKINIKNIFMNFAAENKRRIGYMHKSLNQLNSLSQSKFSKNFYEIQKTSDRNEVINSFISENPKFFNTFRSQTVRFYYSHPVSWKRLNYHGPPQPEGFMDYHTKPKV